MLDRAELYWRLAVENAAQSRHHEQQRTTVTGYFTAIAGAMIGLVTLQKCVPSDTRLVSVLLMAIGAFGAYLCLVQSERAYKHYARAREFRRLVASEIAGADLDGPQSRGDDKAKARYKLVYNRRLTSLWVTLHLLIVFLGGVVPFAAELGLPICQP